MPTPREQRCPVCGEPASVVDRFCGSCGSAVTLSTLGTPPPARTTSDLAARLRAAAPTEYEILDELGRGGMATVFLARQIDLNRRVAIKVIAPNYALDPLM